MITPTEQHTFETSNPLTAQLSCQHNMNNDGAVCGRLTVMTDFCTQYAPSYEDDYGKLFRPLVVKMEYASNKREVIALAERLASETFGIYPTFQNVSIGDLIEADLDNLFKDYEIPKLIELGYGEEYNRALTAHDDDCSTRAMRTMMANEMLVRNDG